MKVVLKTEKQRLGALGETLAERFLVSRGFVVLMRNYRRPWGEIDIIAEKGRIVRFVEVKTMSEDGTLHHQPEDMVDERKLAKLARTASLFMEENEDAREFQLDVVAIILDTKTQTARCRLIEQVL